MIKNLIRRNRSFRRFHEREAVSRETLRELVELARLSASAANLQPLRYILSNEPEKNARIFPCTAWAGYLKDWPGPAPGERPSAYIVMVGDASHSRLLSCDAGIAAQSILLGAAERGLGGCIIGSIDQEQLRSALKIPNEYEIVLIIALGKPAEKVVLEDIRPGDDIKYWRDAEGVHHVPKRPLEELILDL